MRLASIAKIPILWSVGIVIGAVGVVPSCFSEWLVANWRPKALLLSVSPSVVHQSTKTHTISGTRPRSWLAVPLRPTAALRNNDVEDVVASLGHHIGETITLVEHHRGTIRPTRFLSRSRSRRWAAAIAAVCSCPELTWRLADWAILLCQPALSSSSPRDRRIRKAMP